jgi:hypothetical protein
MRALSIRQPYAELILRGIKTVEYRTRPTRILGERFHIYASKGSGVRVQGSAKAWSRDLAAGDAALPEWMIELAEQIKLIPPGTELPRGVIVGSAVVERCEAIGPQRSEVTGHRSETSFFAWHLADVERARTLLKPKRQPQPAWFKPF